MIYVKDFESARASINEALDFMKKTENDLRSKAETEFPVVQKFVEPTYDGEFYYGKWVLSTPSALFKERDSFYSYGDPEYRTDAQIDTRLAKIQNALTKVKSALETAAELNKPIALNNQAVVKKIYEIMKFVGIPETYSERDPKSRAYIPKQITKQAGFKGDIQRNIKQYDPCVDMIKNTDKMIAAVNLYAASLKGSVKNLAAIKIAQEEENKLKQVGFDIKSRYGSSTDTLNDTYKKIIEESYPLKLAHFMRVAKETNNILIAVKTWNDVKLESDKFENTDIFDQISELIKRASDANDVMILRDQASFNYETLFEYVRRTDPQLLDDYRLCKSLVD